MGIDLNDSAVVLPTRNESRNIRNFLRSLSGNMSPAAVDASEDKAADIVSHSRPDYTMVTRHPGALTEARRMGAVAADTRRLLFTDADIVFSGDYFRNVGKLADYDIICGPKLSRGRSSACCKRLACGRGIVHANRVSAASGPYRITRNGPGYRSRMNTNLELQNGN